MRGIKIAQQDFELKMPGGLMREGGRICGTLRYYFFGGWSGNESRLWLDLVNHRTVKVGGHLPWTNYTVELIRLKCLSCKPQA